MSMRRRTTYLILPLLMLVSCVDSDFDPSLLSASLQARYVRTSQDAFSCYSASAQSFSFTITSIDTPWRFADLISWTSVNPTEGSQSASISLDVEENPSGNTDRLGVFYLKSVSEDWDFSTPMTVSQPAATPYATPDNTSITISGATGSGSMNVRSNCTWTITSSTTWLKAEVDQTGTAFSYAVDENLTNVSRSATLTISHESKKLAMISVTQRAAGITMETTTLQFENTAGAYELTVNSEAAWTASTSQNWIQVNPQSGNAGTSKITVSALQNAAVGDRSGYVYLSIGGNRVVEIPIKQRGIYIEFGAQSLSFSADGETKNIHISSNTNWTITSYPSWVTVSPQSGEGGKDITLVAADNPNVTSRSGVIKATQAGLNLVSELSVSQPGKTFNYGDSQLNCSDKEQTLKITVTTTGKWAAKSNNNWITVTPSSHTGNGELSVHMTENGTDDSRTGSITLTIGDKSYDVTIIQSGKYFTVNYKENSFGSTGANLAIEVITNDSWTASVVNNPPWITLSQKNGTGNANFTATIADNPSVNSRSATITLTTAHDKSVKIQILQAARYLTVDHQNIPFFAAGGTSENVTISTDGQYSITHSATWFTINEKGGGVFNVTATKNTTKEVREGAITIKLTDLQEGTFSITLPILQTADGANFIIVGYGDDKNWDIGANASVTVTVTGYGTDKNWDSNTQGTNLTVTITGFTGDKNWDIVTTSSGNISFDGYSSDYNWEN